MEPKILYDHQIFESQRFGGISRYFVELIKRQQYYQLPLVDSQNEYLKELSQYVELIEKSKRYDDSFLNGFSFKGRKTLLRMFKDYLYPLKNNKKLSIQALKAGAFDLFHPTYYNSYFKSYLSNKPLVVTIHDMIHEKYPNYFHYDHSSKFKKEICHRADAIIAISNSTKNDLLSHINIEVSKIKVIYHGSSMEGVESIKPAITLDKPYILFVGSRKGYKNFSTFVLGVFPILNKYLDINAVCVGDDFNDRELNELKQANLVNRFNVIRATDNQLKYLYQHALCFVFPSLYEGFGIPILESMSSDCVPILSNTSSLPEIGGDAALYFDPNRPEEMTFQINRIIEDSELKRILLAKGKLRTTLFSWDKSSNETKSVYRLVC